MVKLVRFDIMKADRWLAAGESPRVVCKQRSSGESKDEYSDI